MKKAVMSCLTFLSLSATALAADAAPAAPAAPAQPAMPDMAKVGPMAFAPKNEKQDKKELDALYAALTKAHQQGDLNAVADMMAFPVIMMSDDSKGNLKTTEMGRDQWMAMMKPFLDPAHAKEMKDMKMKESCVVMSDNLASCENQFSMPTGKMKGKVNSHAVVIRTDGKWKVKTKLEAGWGDMAPAPNAAGGAGSK
jgi:ketosteroid isomerase-like protein